MGFWSKSSRPADTVSPVLLRPQRPFKLVRDSQGLPATNIAGIEQSQPTMFKKAAAVNTAFKKRSPKTGQTLEGLRFRVRLYIDFSQSMEWSDRRYYSSGVMQTIVERFLALGLQVDTNGVIEVIPFSGHLHPELKVGLTADPDKGVLDYRDVVDRHIWRHGRAQLGGTAYVPFMDDIIRVAQTQEEDEVIYAGIVTDGDPNDSSPRVSDDPIIERVERASQWAALLKFMAVNPVDYLQELDDLEETRPGVRLFDNVDTKFFDGDEWPTIQEISDAQFAEAMADEISASIAGAIDAGVLLSA